MSSATPAQEAERKNAAAERQDAQLDRLEVVGSRIKRESGAAAVSDQAQLGSVVLPPLDDDATLPPSQWIERIRARVNAADGRGARESLRRFHARYPDAEIPADLAPLRK